MRRPAASLPLAFSLTLADDSRWLVESVADSLLSTTVACDLAAVMGLEPAATGLDVEADRRLVIDTDGVTLPADRPASRPRVRWALRSDWRSETDRGDPEYVALVISAGAMLARAMTSCGVLLLHGALLAGPGADDTARGVLLSGRGGSGKTTAAGKLRPPWQALSDDQALVVDCGARGVWAHPWPTWSLYDEAGLAGTWTVQSGVPLAALAFLRQGAPRALTTIGAATAAARAVAAADDVGGVIGLRLDPADEREVRLRRLDLAGRLALRVPAYELTLGLDDDVVAALTPLV